MQIGPPLSTGRPTKVNRSNTQRQRKRSQTKRDTHYQPLNLAGRGMAPLIFVEFGRAFPRVGWMGRPRHTWWVFGAVFSLVPKASTSVVFLCHFFRTPCPTAPTPLPLDPSMGQRVRTRGCCWRRSPLPVRSIQQTRSKQRPSRPRRVIRFVRPKILSSRACPPRHFWGTGPRGRGRRGLGTCIHAHGGVVSRSGGVDRARIGLDPPAPCD